MRLLPLLFATLLVPLMAQAQSSSSGGASSSSGSSSSRSMGGSSGSAKTEAAPSGTLRTGPDRSPANQGGSATMNQGGSATMGGGSSTTLGAPGGGTAPGSSGRGGQQARMPDECFGPVTDPRCPTAGAPTGTGLGDRGTGMTTRRPYGPADSPVKGGPPFTGPTGRPLDLPEEGR